MTIQPAELLNIWKDLNAALSELYRQAAREKDAGYDKPATKEQIDMLEKSEHDAWLAYRESTAL